jgi:ABC-2 type transport system ATP-binding protein
MSDAIIVEGLEKSYGSVRALCGVDFSAPTGSVLGLLGPNGAGKTTAVRILATLLKPDAGTARVAGLDAVRDAAALRAKIGLAGQYAAVDENLTGSENLEGLTVGVPVRGRSGVIAEAVRRLDQADVVIDDIALRRPTLDDVFIGLTGRSAEEEPPTEIPEPLEEAA